MASIFENQYKLLARSGNRIQEVRIIDASQADNIDSVITNTSKSSRFILDIRQSII